MQNNNISGLIIGQNTIYLDEVPSTNTYLSNMLANFTPLPEGTAIIAGHQYAGKGQRSGTWSTEPNKNLTASIYLKPHFLHPKDQFILSCCIAIATAEWLQSYVNQTVKIKWPNDIYINSSKIGGILIENKIKGKSLDASIIGIGININQKDFMDLSNATSLAILNNKADYKIRILAQELFQTIQNRYLALEPSHYQEVLDNYNERLFWKGERRPFLWAGQQIEGIIQDVKIDGKLNILRDEGVQHFDIKEVAFQLKP